MDSIRFAPHSRTAEAHKSRSRWRRLTFGFRFRSSLRRAATLAAGRAPTTNAQARRANSARRPTEPSLDGWTRSAGRIAHVLMHTACKQQAGKSYSSIHVSLIP